ncbi:4-hydroxybenzoate polyprenyltransferase [Malassezia vespertilionis]|uniref:4-hydroxybenzoate polyprenyltransferase n=1 Tax=Malassezia vespertilionis TaxID=2020962 RepID=UPI0024B09B55|nr:4-hydroxybenzoate polyprenyltransferase [Malassezia vespertilionis]WFD08507.1 4-hydroxybenzoate polyprenyltransferase [Malassezia vespertilionis]
MLLGFAGAATMRRLGMASRICSAPTCPNTAHRTFTRVRLASWVHTTPSCWSEAKNAESGAANIVHSAPPQRPKFSLKPYMELARLDRPIGTWLLYLPCSWSITMASHYVDAPISVWLTNLALFGVGAVVMRGAGCTINDMWDVEYDKKVERTKDRPLASGAVSYKQAGAFLALQLTAGLGVLVNLNTNSCYWPVVLPLYASTTVWGVVYDTIYAHQDKVDDRKSGVKSTAILFGDRKTKPIIAAFTLVWLALLAYSVNTESPIFASSTASDGQPRSLREWMTNTLYYGHPFFALSWLGAAGHMAWQIKTVDLNNRADCWAKFSSNRVLGLIVFSGLAADYLYQKKYAPKKASREAQIIMQS